MGTVTILSQEDVLTGTPQRVWNLPPDPYEIEVEKREEIIRNWLDFFTEETGMDLTYLNVTYTGTEYTFNYDTQRSMSE
jgi:hypothetical protein